MFGCQNLSWGMNPLAKPFFAISRYISECSIIPMKREKRLKRNGPGSDSSRVNFTMTTALFGQGKEQAIMLSRSLLRAIGPSRCVAVCRDSKISWDLAQAQKWFLGKKDAPSLHAATRNKKSDLSPFLFFILPLLNSTHPILVRSILTFASLRKPSGLNCQLFSLGNKEPLVQIQLWPRRATVQACN